MYIVLCFPIGHIHMYCTHLCSVLVFVVHICAICPICPIPAEGLPHKNSYVTVQMVNEMLYLIEDKMPFYDYLLQCI